MLTSILLFVFGAKVGRIVSKSIKNSEFLMTNYIRVFKVAYFVEYGSYAMIIFVLLLIYLGKR